MNMKSWEKKVLDSPGANKRVAEIEDELRLAAGLTALREREGLSQRDLAKRIGVSQPRVAAIEQSRNVTLDVLEQYVDALGGRLEINVIKGTRKVELIGGRKRAGAPKKPVATETAARKNRAARKPAARVSHPPTKAASKRRSA